jgi:hypothetical protein
MTEPVWWACVNFGQWKSEPGPMPHYWTDANGNVINLAALTPNQRAGVAWRQVEHVNWREIDEEIEEIVGFEKSLDGNTPIVTWSYRLLPGARAVMIRKTDEKAEEYRRAWITASPGQVMEYDEAFREAQAAIVMNEDIPAGMFPFLEADIGVTDYGDRKVENVREAAQVVLAARNIWAQAGAMIRTVRLARKAAITGASTDAQAFAIYSTAWPI